MTPRQYVLQTITPEQVVIWQSSLRMWRAARLARLASNEAWNAAIAHRTASLAWKESIRGNVAKMYRGKNAKPLTP
jgi:hypothetical protein